MNHLQIIMHRCSAAANTALRLANLVIHANLTIIRREDYVRCNRAYPQALVHAQSESKGG